MVTSEAQKKATKKYMNKLKEEQPERYKNMIRAASKRVYLRNKQNPEYVEKNRQTVKEYYEKNKEEILKKRKEYYKVKKESIKNNNNNNNNIIEFN